MTQNTLVVGILLAIALGIGGWFVWAGKGAIPGGVACTMEAKLCPDGSAVGRSGPKCEFAECPTATSTSGRGTITGKVLLSPICPVERFPADPMCARIGYQTTVEARTNVRKSDVVVSVESNAQGVFSLFLLPGVYTLSAKGGAVYPRCESIAVEVLAGALTTADIECDTGIRTPTPSPQSVSVSGKIGETFSGLDVSLTPLSVVEDSRCPVDVVCIQAGTVRVKTRIISGLGTSDMTLTLGTPITTEAEEVTLVSVSPAPYSTVTISPNAYVFTFSIKKR